MRRFARSETYGKLRVANAVIFVVLGILVGGRAYAAVGPTVAAIPAYALALAMIGLGASRIVAFVRARRGA